MDTRLSSSFHHLIVCQHNYYLHISECAVCLHDRTHPYRVQDYILEVCGDIDYLKGEVKAAEQVYFKMCEEILDIKQVAQK